MSERTESTLMLPSRLYGCRTVGVYSPSGSIAGDPVEKRRLFDAGLKRLHDLGFQTRLAPRAQNKWFHMSGTVEERASDLQFLLDDDDVDIIIPTIGGHVASQILQAIDFDLIANSGKAIFGFSDNSIIPLITSARTGAITFHTLCDLTFGFGRFADGYPITESSFLSAVRRQEFDFAGTRRWRASNIGRASGILLGGNLKGICSLVGTPWCPEWTGRVMFWETADPHHAVLQQLQHLQNAGILQALAGMVIGTLANVKESFYGDNEVIPIEEFLIDILEFRAPLIVEADIGHDTENVTLPLGAHVAVTSEPGAEAEHLTLATSATTPN